MTETKRRQRHLDFSEGGAILLVVERCGPEGRVERYHGGGISPIETFRTLQRGTSPAFAISRRIVDGWVWVCVSYPFDTFGRAWMSQ
jgi:hypothetical protein